MKTKINLFLLALLITPFGITQAESTDTQTTQAATNQDGECEVFPTQADVPDDWKQVPSCDLVKDANFGKSLEERLRERFRSKNQARSTEGETRSESSGKYIRQGRGALTRENRNRRLSTKTNTNYGERRTTTRRNYSQAALDRIKRYRTNKGGYQQEGDTTKEERAQRRSYRAPIASRNSDVRREGLLSNKQKWTTELNKRNEKNIKNATTKRWVNYNNELSRKELLKGRIERKKKIAGERRIKRIWKGERLEGDVSGNSTNTNE